MNNMVLLDSPENYIQYPLINHNGKEYEKGCVCVCVCVCVTESHCWTTEINFVNQLQLNFFLKGWEEALGW